MASVGTPVALSVKWEMLKAGGGHFEVGDLLCTLPRAQAVTLTPPLTLPRSPPTPPPPPS